MFIQLIYARQIAMSFENSYFINANLLNAIPITIRQPIIHHPFNGTEYAFPACSEYGCFSEGACVVSSLALPKRLRGCFEVRYLCLTIGGI